MKYQPFTYFTGFNQITGHFLLQKFSKILNLNAVDIFSKQNIRKIFIYVHSKLHVFTN